MSSTSACQSCGACCAFFRVSFYWAEGQAGGGVVPDRLTEKVNNHLNCMRGTQSKPVRCVALLGDVGKHVACTIYESRPSPCREFTSNADHPERNPDCDRARAHYGLPPLEYVPVIQVA